MGCSCAPGGIRRLGKRLSWGIGGSAAALVVGAVLGLGDAAVASPGAWAGSSGTGQHTMLRRDWIDDVIDVIDDVAEDLDEADDAIQGNDVAADGVSPLVSVFVLDRLDSVLASIDLLFDPEVGPNVEASLGSIDQTIQPETLAEYAAATLRLADDALLHLETAPAIDEAYIASLLKTIEHLICRDAPHSYQSKAAMIEQGGHPSA